MAEASGGSWLVANELLERGDPTFVDELRRVTESERLAEFAHRWYEDRRPASRRLLLEYLTRPLNAYGHEPLVKRLFKRAEAAGDDEVMGRFLVLFDRSVRRARRTRHQHRYQMVKTTKLAEELRALWTSQGFTVQINPYSFMGSGQYVSAHKTYETILTPRGTTMPRGALREITNPFTGSKFTVSDLAGKIPMKGRALTRKDRLSEEQRKRLERYTLFTVHTRQYLRRRAWRFFRNLAKAQPERYVAAVLGALKLYRDSDTPDGLVLIDNWGLIHILFHHSPVLEARASGWWPVAGRSLGALEPAPFRPELWDAAPRALVELLGSAECRAVRRWAVRMIQRDSGRILSGVGLEELLRLVAHEDAEVAALAADALRGSDRLRSLNVDRWLALLESPNPAVLDLVCDLAAANLRPEQLSFAETARLAASRPLPIARLGLGWLRAKRVESEADRSALLALVDAEAEPLRAEIVTWVRQALTENGAFQPDWVLAFLDSRNADVRAVGWTWFQVEPRARDDVALWGRLLESPHDDIRIALVDELERRTSRVEIERAESLPLDPERLRILWASVLLNIHRGNRTKPAVVRQVVARLERRPEDAPVLLPLLAVALRSVRGPEWRAGLSAVVRLAERRADTAPLVRQTFPELQWT